MISVLQLGVVGYADGLRLQQQILELRKAGEIGDVLLLLEHEPVITLGRNAKAANVLMPAEELATRGVEVFECDRGGDVTFHGPGQIVGYPIVDLRQHELRKCGAGAPARETAVARKTLGVVDYVRQLEEVLIRTCADFGIATKRVAGLTGVWTEPSPPELNREGHDFSRAGMGPPIDGALAPEGRDEAKIAAIGVHISRSVTSHGFALNVNTDLSYFNLIVPCGITSKAVTSMQKELAHDLDLNDVAHSLARNFGTVFGRQMLWVETIDALLGNTVGVPMKAPEELRRLRGEDDLLAT
jgi:lipoyl(octanoyl) transferase